MQWPMSGLVVWTLSWFGHGCEWAGRMDVIMALAWMHWPMNGLVAWTWHNADLSDKESGANEGDGAYYKHVLLVHLLRDARTLA